MRRGDPYLLEVEHRWRVLRDRAWRRKYCKLELGIALICGIGAAVYFLLSVYWRYYAYNQPLNPGHAPVIPSSITIYWRSLGILAGLAVPAGLFFGCLRARQAVLPVEITLALPVVQSVKIELRAIRQALYSTVLPIVAVPLLMLVLAHGARYGLTRTFTGMVFGPVHFEVLYGTVGIAWELLITLGWLLCLLEWQVIMLSRIPPRLNLVWLQALPYAVSWLAGSTAYMAGYYAMLQNGPPRSSLLSLRGQEYDIYALALLLMAAGLIVAPMLWRWAAAGYFISRWVVVTFLCTAAACVPSMSFGPSGIDAAPVLALASSFGRGVYLGSMNPLFVSGGLARENYLDTDILAGYLAPDYESIKTIQSPQDEDTNLIWLMDSERARLSCKTPGPGVVVTANLFLPWYLALFWLVLYYGYSYYILRNTAENIPKTQRIAMNAAL